MPDFMNTELNFIDIFEKSELIKYRDDILALFYESFGTQLPVAVWDWAYLENPAGEPVVSLAYDNNELVGHYAVIPYFLRNRSQLLKSYLSMTTMVKKEYRRLGLFVAQAERVYSIIEKYKKADCVFGFPNAMSAPGFRKRLKWIVNEDYNVINVNKTQLNDLFDYMCFTSSGDYFRINDASFINWRRSKPDMLWNVNSGLGLKKFGNNYDLMWFENIDSLKEISEVDSLNVLVRGAQDELLQNGFEVSFNYPIGYRTFNNSPEPEFLVQMAMSDVF